MKLKFSPTPTQEDILFSLARYKFLTTSQFLRLGISTKPSNLSRAFKELKVGKFVNSEGFSQQIRVGNRYPRKRLENIYYLTKRGALMVSEWLECNETEIKYPKGRSSYYSQNYWHNRFTIDCEIEARRWAGSKKFELQIADRDFDKVGSNRYGNGKARTTITYGDNQIIKPDANFVLYNGDEHKLFTLELHNTKSVNDIKKQLVKHIYALKNGGVGLHYSIKKLHRILNVFENESKMRIVMKHLNDSQKFNGLEQFFVFKSIYQIIGNTKSEDGKVCNFYDGWLTFKGEKEDLL